MKHVAKDSSARTGNWIDTFGFCDVDVAGIWGIRMGLVCGSGRVGSGSVAIVI